MVISKTIKWTIEIAGWKWNQKSSSIYGNPTPGASKIAIKYVSTRDNPADITSWKQKTS